MTISHKEALSRLIDHQNFTREEMRSIFGEIMRGEMPDMVAAGLIMGLRVKKETVEEITAAAEVMREFSLKVEIPNAWDALDMCGTGGDGAGTFNISTTAMFIAAAAGVPVAKHGNRSASSVCGSADVLEAMGANVEIPPDQVAVCLKETGIGFMLTSYFHTSMHNAHHLRRGLNVKTMFNILGPLTNPALAANQLMGVFHPDLIKIQPRVLRELGSRHVVNLYGLDGLDEASLGAPTLIGELKDGEILEYRINPEMYGFQMTSSDRFKIKTREESCQILKSVLDNEASPALDIVVFNAGLAIYAANLADTIDDGIAQAKAKLQSGEARQTLDKFIEFTRSIKA